VLPEIIICRRSNAALSELEEEEEERRREKGPLLTLLSREDRDRRVLSPDDRLYRTRQDRTDRTGPTDERKEGREVVWCCLLCSKERE